MNTLTRENPATQASYKDVHSAIQYVLDEVQVMIATAKTELSMIMAEALDAKIDARLTAALAEFREEVKASQNYSDQAMLRLEAVIRAIPHPEITVAPAEVNLQMPTRRMIKRITYDDQGRPSIITEEEG